MPPVPVPVVLMMIELAPNNPYGLALATPVMTAAGCFGYGIEYGRIVQTALIGAIVTRTTTLRPRRTARPPRIIETPAGLLSVGPWPNPGLETVLNRYAPIWATWSVPVILSITGESSHEYAQIAEALEGVEGIAALELALPVDASKTAGIVAAARRSTFLPLLVKLPLLEAEPLAALAQAAAAAGADALTMFAGPRGAYIDPASGEQLEGWHSGPAIRPIVLRRLIEIAPHVSVPFVACGGIASAEDAKQTLALGAAAVQVGSMLLANPYAAGEIGQALAVPA